MKGKKKNQVNIFFIFKFLSFILYIYIFLFYFIYIYMYTYMCVYISIYILTNHNFRFHGFDYNLFSGDSYPFQSGGGFQTFHTKQRATCLVPFPGKGQERQTVTECPATPYPAPGWTPSRGLSFHLLLTISLNTQITRHARRVTVSFPEKSCTSGWQFGYKDF